MDSSPTALFQNRYRIASARWPGYDYSQAGAYFVTICTAHREPFFGAIVAPDGDSSQAVLQGTPLALQAVACWQAIPQFHPFATPADFVVMPDHVHGILFIDRPPGFVGQGSNRFGPQRDNLAAVIRGFKMGVTKAAAALTQPADQPAFGWQARFHDRVIRNEQELERLQWYIAHNPSRWAQEQDQPQGIFR